MGTNGIVIVGLVRQYELCIFLSVGLATFPDWCSGGKYCKNFRLALFSNGSVVLDSMGNKRQLCVISMCQSCRTRLVVG